MLFNLSWFDPAAQQCPYEKEPERMCPWNNLAKPWNAPFGKVIYIYLIYLFE